MTIAEHTLTFVMDPFANYVVQFILNLGMHEVNRVVTEKLLTNLIQLSKQKFSSNVIEKCLELNSPDLNQSLVAALMH